ncbi:MAG: VacJ family lipoprotein [Betaproteobacteria bacterium]|nr:MAG: VacJ family lipoprotein [Betaproteobacteria bacterium]
MTRLILLACLTIIASGCATSQNPQDPWEGMNRKIYGFNRAVDDAYIRPIASGYRSILPSPVRTGVSNFFRNLGVIVTGFNNVLQLKFKDVPVDVIRFTSNVLYGLGGLIDVATYMRIPYNDEDFGQTLGYWGFESGPYLVLPFFGPSTVRDGIGLPVDIYVSPIYDTIGDEGIRWGLLALFIIDTRANLIDTETFLRQAALDEYSFVRDSYLQRREYLVNDGKVAEPAIDEQDDETKSLLELEAEEFGDEPPIDGPAPQSDPDSDRPKSLLELEQEEFGDEPIFEEYPPPQDAQPTDRPNPLLELEKEEFGDEPVLEENPPPQ